jgi:hypothetical protein
MNRWAERREGWREQEREHKTLQHGVCERSMNHSLSPPIHHSLLPPHLFIPTHLPTPSHCHVVTHCSVSPSLSCPRHHSLLPPHLFIPNITPPPTLSSSSPAAMHAFKRAQHTSAEHMWMIVMVRCVMVRHEYSYPILHARTHSLTLCFFSSGNSFAKMSTTSKRQSCNKHSRVSDIPHPSLLSLSYCDTL